MTISAPARIRSARAAGWAALVAVVAIALSVVLNAVFESIGEVLRLVIGGTFFVGGLSALVLSIAAVRAGARNATVWLSLAVGCAATALLVAEFTIME